MANNRSTAELCKYVANMEQTFCDLKGRRILCSGSSKKNG